MAPRATAHAQQVSECVWLDLDEALLRSFLVHSERKILEVNRGDGSHSSRGMLLMPLNFITKSGCNGFMWDIPLPLKRKLYKAG